MNETKQFIQILNKKHRIIENQVQKKL